MEQLKAGSEEAELSFAKSREESTSMVEHKSLIMGGIDNDQNKPKVITRLHDGSSSTTRKNKSQNEHTTIRTFPFV